MRLCGKLNNLSLQPSQVAHHTQAYPGFRRHKATSHRMVNLSIKFAGTHLYTWVERGTVRAKGLAQEHNTVSPARARTQTAPSRVERPNHEVTQCHAFISLDGYHRINISYILSLGALSDAFRAALHWKESYSLDLFVCS